MRNLSNESELHLNLFQVVNCINVFCANINYLFEFIFSPENAKKLSKPLLYINMHQDSEHNSSNHAAHTAEVERNCCSEYHRSAVIPILVEDARIAHACAIVY